MFWCQECSVSSRATGAHSLLRSCLWNGIEKLGTPKDSVFEGFLSLDWVWTLPRSCVQVQLHLHGRESQGWNSLEFSEEAPGSHPSSSSMVLHPHGNQIPWQIHFLLPVAKESNAPAKIPSSGHQKSHFSPFPLLLTPTISLLLPFPQSSIKAPGKWRKTLSS